MSDHMYIARERFLDLMASHPDGGAEYAAVKAIEEASTFMKTYDILWEGKEQVIMGTKPKGCKACHGSGGKRADPCKACGGTGKVLP